MEKIVIIITIISIISYFLYLKIEAKRIREYIDLDGYEIYIYKALRDWLRYLGYQYPELTAKEIILEIQKKFKK